MPKLNIDEWRTGSGDINPVFGEATGPFSELILGDQVGLSQFGVRIERLAPGSKSSIRHWHSSEDELIYVLSGELVLVEERETTLHTGDAAGWAAGDAIAHNLVNRSDSEASFLIVGGRAADDIVTYPDHGLRLLRNGRNRRFEKL
jgi:uncharacterized cupin superfamily protein